jgi:DNA-binding LytR/AlgR family response regulator
MMRKMDAYAKMQAVDTKRVFPQKKGIIVLALDEILYCKADLIHTKIVLCSGEEVIVKMKIGETFETINHKDFIRTGRSNIINRSYLRKIDKKHHKCLLYYNAQTWEVPVSKNTMGILEKLNVQPIY